MAGWETTPNGYYNIERMLKILKSKGAQIGVCGTCMDGRGIKPERLAEGGHRSTMDELAAWTAAADRILVGPMMPFDVIAFGAHPDDLDGVMGGAVKMARKGLSVLFVDLCDLEPTRHAPMGSATSRLSRQSGSWEWSAPHWRYRTG